MPESARRGRLAIFALLGMFVIVFLFALFVAVPKAASITLPYKWSGVPLGAKRPAILQFYGDPFSARVAEDEWIARRTNGEYRLEVGYKDSVAVHYLIRFNYRLGFLRKSYLLREDSLMR